MDGRCYAVAVLVLCIIVSVARLEPSPPRLDRGASAELPFELPSAEESDDTADDDLLRTDPERPVALGTRAAPGFASTLTLRSAAPIRPPTPPPKR